ncbi:leucyl aminopeptidase [Stakelama sediminis]|uniref:Probable cytosol aminopeptidase n=1 Tax=Stakelama sediminis TaxID=463200 RepID=A0A840YZC7_9SPHN|nr:leucyl aminopeptidase [Stakelama sediminis]MBB5718870.1 leucyl aminopeptidase [Stakelama sediminis]
MEIDFAATPGETSDLLVLPVQRGGLTALSQSTLSEQARKLLTSAAEKSRFEGDSGTTCEVFADDAGTLLRIALVGVGNADEPSYERAGGAIAARYISSGVKTMTVDFSTLKGAVSAKQAARFVAGAAQKAWRHDVYRTKLPAGKKPTLERIAIANAPDGSTEAWAYADAVTQGMELTRKLVTEPANILFPESFVEEAQALAELGIELTVLDEAQMRELGMGALLGVSQGAEREGRLLAMRWNGKGSGDVELALVGKGVTFDSGGISLKPGPGMEDMKWDMGGAGAVIGTMKALALRKAKANVLGVCGLVENMPDGNAQRPGDVVTSLSGQTIEVINTDAEGRLVLCDALTWVQRNFKPKTIIDLATLTGAMIISLGHEHAGLFSNDDSLADAMLAAGQASGDKLWRMPLGDAYDKLLDSPIADMKNVGPRAAGSITAAQFLKRFIDDGVQWAHLDIAGMAWSDKAGPNYEKGATGFGVRVLDRLVADRFEG